MGFNQQYGDEHQQAAKEHPRRHLFMQKESRKQNAENRLKGEKQRGGAGSGILLPDILEQKGNHGAEQS